MSLNTLTTAERYTMKSLPEPKNTLEDFMDFVSGKNSHNSDDGYGSFGFGLDLDSDITDCVFEVVFLKNTILEERDELEDKNDYEIHMPIDEFVSQTNMDSIKLLLNRRGIIQIMRYIRDEYGNDHMADMLDKDDDMFQRSLCYFVLEEYMREIIDLKDKWDEEEEAFLNEEHSDVEEVDSDEASDAETEVSDD